jgi:hypothetical protein
MLASLIVHSLRYHETQKNIGDTVVVGAVRLEDGTSFEYDKNGQLIVLDRGVMSAVDSHSPINVQPHFFKTRPSKIELSNNSTQISQPKCQARRQIPPVAHHQPTLKPPKSRTVVLFECVAHPFELKPESDTHPPRHQALAQMWSILFV